MKYESTTVLIKKDIESKFGKSDENVNFIDCLDGEKTKVTVKITSTSKITSKVK